MSFSPNLSSLSLVRPTGMPAQTRAQRAAMQRLMAQGAVLGNNDLLVRILTALNQGSLDDACELAMRWCATHRAGCNDETWQALITLVFPGEGENAQRPKAKFTELCLRWDRGRKAKYDELLAKRNARYPGRTPNGTADAEAMAEFLRTEYAFDASDLESAEEELPGWFRWTMTTELWEETRVAALLVYGIRVNFYILVWLIEAGYVHVSDVFFVPPTPTPYDNFLYPAGVPGGPSAQPLTGDRVAFTDPNTMLGMAIQEAMITGFDSLMQRLLAFGADPNAPIWQPTVLQYSHGITVAVENLHFADEGTAENMAFWHIIDTLCKKLRNQQSRGAPLDPYQIEDPFEGWYFDRMVFFDGAQNTPGKLPRLLKGFRMLRDYGGDVYGAAVMYNVYARHFNNRMFYDMARDLRLMSRYVIMPYGAVRPNRSTAQFFHDRHASRLPRRCPFYDPARAPPPLWQSPPEDEDDADDDAGVDGSA